MSENAAGAAAEAAGTAGTGDAGAGPQRWAFALFVFFGAAQIAAGLIFFFAYNWRALPDEAKIALPQAVMALAFLGWALSPARSRAGTAAGVVATLMIGVSMGVVGQVYQLGADPWPLFAIWAAFALPLAVLARSGAHFTVWFVIASIAYGLYTDEVVRPFLPQAHSLITAGYAVAAVAVLAVRERITGGAPRWQRWFFLAVALGAALLRGWAEILDSDPFSEGVAASLSLFVLGAAALVFYRRWRPDRPAQALALFAAAAWIAVFGVRILFLAEPNSAGEISLVLFASALWVVAVTVGLAKALRRIVGAGAAS